MRSGRPSKEDVEEIRGRALVDLKDDGEEEVGGTPRPGRPTPPKGRLILGVFVEEEEEDVLEIERARTEDGFEGGEGAERVFGFEVGSAEWADGVVMEEEAFSCRAAMRALIMAERDGRRKERFPFAHCR